MKTAKTIKVYRSLQEAAKIIKVYRSLQKTILLIVKTTETTGYYIANSYNYR